jgi:cytochrome c-type biogenesis protein CcmH
MTLLFPLALMTLVAVFAVLWPLSRARRSAAVASDVEIYRAQLREIEGDRERGSIPAEEAEAARVEVARRLLAAAHREKESGAAGISRAVLGRRVVAVIAFIALPLFAAGVYGMLGRPGLPDLPLAARLDAAPETQDIATLVSRVEAQLSHNPEDGRGWDVLAPIYLRMGRSQDSATAYANAIRLLGDSAEREAGRGEALATSAGGVVTAEAEKAFRAALKLDPKQVRARFFLARADEQAGKEAEAANTYRSLLANAPAGAPWRPLVSRALTETALGDEGKMPAVDPSLLADTTPQERMKTIHGMVEKLAGEAKDNPGDLGRQLRLIRAWAMLGEADKSKAALKAAKAHFAGDAQASRRLDDLALGLGLSGGPA